MSTNRSEYMKQYAKENLKRVPLDLKHEEYDKLKAAAANVGESVNRYIKESIKRRIDSGT